MNSKEQVLEKNFPCPNGQDRNQILSAMEEYASLKMGELIEWMEGQYNELNSPNTHVCYEGWAKGISVCIDHAKSMIKEDKEHGV